MAFFTAYYKPAEKYATRSSPDPTLARGGSNEWRRRLQSKPDPVSRSDIAAGRRITYTLSFENAGQGAAAVDYTDYLGGVLDDADLVSGPTVTGGLTASGPTGGEIQVGGSVAAGATETVTYEVVVKSYAQQGDHRLGNFLVPAGFDPPTLCDPNDPLCTWHELDPPPPGLSVTGATVGASVLVALMLLLAGGGLLMPRRRRRAAGVHRAV